MIVNKTIMPFIGRTLSVGLSEILCAPIKKYCQRFNGVLFLTIIIFNG